MEKNQVNLFVFFGKQAHSCKKCFYACFFLLFMVNGGLLPCLKGQALSREQIDTWNADAHSWWHEDPAIGGLYADSALNAAEELNYPKGLLEALINKGIDHYYKAEYTKAKIQYEKARAIQEENGLSSDVAVYELSLAKKTGDYRLLYELFQDTVPDKKARTSTNLFLLKGIFSGFVEMGDIFKAESLWKILSTSKLFREDLNFRGEALMNQAKLLGVKGDYQQALTMVDSAIFLFEKVEDQSNIADTYLIKAELLSSQGSLHLSRYYGEEALRIFKAISFPFGEAKALNQLGEVAALVAEYSGALNYYFQAFEIYEEQGNINEQAKVYIDMAWVNYEQNESEKAIELAKKAVTISEHTGNRLLEGRAYNALGVFHDKINRWEEALHYYEKSEAVWSSTGYKMGVAINSYNVGYLYEQLGRRKEAFKNYHYSYFLEKELNNKLGYAISEYSLGAYHTKEKNFDSASFYLERSQKTLIEIGAKQSLLSNLLHSIELAEAMGNLKKANQLLHDYMELKDSLINENKNVQIADIQARYDLKTKESEIDLLNLENENQQAELEIQRQVIRNQRMTVVSIFVGALFLLITLAFTLRVLAIRKRVNRKLERLYREIQDQSEEIQTQSEELQEANNQIQHINANLEEEVRQRNTELVMAYEELDTFFYKSSHDFRGPLTTFMGLAELGKTMVKDAAIKDLFEKVDTTAKKLDRLVNKLQTLSTINAQNQKVEKIKLRTFMEEMIESYETSAQEMDFTFKVDILEEIYVHTYHFSLKTVVHNLIENSLYYRGRTAPFLHISGKMEDTFIQLKFEDNGIGIRKDIQEEVFKMYVRASERSSGNGLGLYLVKKSIDKMKGTIQLESHAGDGCTFTINLPFDLSEPLLANETRYL